MKKAANKTLARKPLNMNASPKHSFDAIKYTLDVDLYSCYTAPYPKSFTGSVIVTIKIDLP